MTTPDTTDTPEAPEADLVRRTLRAVADGLDVPAAPLPPEARLGLAAGADAVGDRPAVRREARWRAPLAVTAAAIVLAAGIWAVVRSTENAEDTAPRPPAGEPAVEPGVPTALPTTPVAGWLPAGMQPEDEHLISTPPLPTVKDSALLTGPGDDAVGVALTAPDANQADLAVRALAPFVGTPYGDDGQPRLTRHEVGPGASLAAAWRRSPWADAAAESAGLAALTPAAPLDLAPAGWRSRAMRVDWAPGVGATASVSYAKPDTTVSVALHSVRGRLPDRDLLAATLADEERVEVRGHRGWFVPLDSPGADSAVLWQEAEGYVGVVVANDVARRDVLRVADDGDWLEPPTPEEMAQATTTMVPPPRPMSGPDDWPTLCGPRPEGQAVPREEAGAATGGLIALTGTDDVGYRLLLWDDHVTAGGPARSGPCWRLDVGVPARTKRGGGEVVTPGWGPVSTLEPVAWTAEETVFFAASRSDVTFTADVEVVTTPLDERMEDGTRFWFVRVARDGRPEVTLDLHDEAGRSVGTAGPLVLDGLS